MLTLLIRTNTIIVLLWSPKVETADRHLRGSGPLELTLGTQYKWSSQNHCRRQAVFRPNPYEPIALDAGKGLGRVAGPLHDVIEFEHELTAGFVEYWPKGHQKVLHARLNKPASQTHDAFSESRASAF